MNSQSQQLLIFSRAPVLGEVKTRLQPEFTPEQSLALHKKMLLNTLGLSAQLNDIEVTLCCAPDKDAPFFLDRAKRFSVRLENQQGANLGERMANALSNALKNHAKVVIIGTDCPGINKEYIQKAFDALNEVDVVIGPASDGGYVLLGLKKISEALFRNISWGTDSVLEQTRKAVKELHWSSKELGIMHDIDRPEDLYRYQDLLNEIS